MNGGEEQRTAKLKCLVDYFFVVTMLLGNTSYTVGKPIYFPFKWCHICKEHVFGG